MTTYLTLQGQKSGQLKGGLTTKGHEGQILVQTVGHSIASPVDANSGVPTGRCLHHPLTLTKGVDCSSPPLYQMLVTRETITQLDLDLWLPQGGSSPSGATEVRAYTIRLTNALLVGVDVRAATADEQLSFTYQTIDWTWLSGGITAGTSWVPSG